MIGRTFPVRVRRLTGRAKARARRVGRSGESGFILLESIIAITLITVIMSAVGAEYVNGLYTTNSARLQTVAVEIAGSNLDQIQALHASDLVTGRGSNAVDTERATVAQFTTVAATTFEAYDATASATNTGTTIPTTAAPTTVGTTTYSVYRYFECTSAATNGSCITTSSQSSLTANNIRATVVVTWAQRKCPPVTTASTTGPTCSYSTSSIINADTDPTFDLNQPLPAAPVVGNPTALTVAAGDAVSYQMAVQSGTGVTPFTWAVTSGSLPAGLTMSTTGLITGTITGAATTNTTTITVTDSYLRTASSTITWTVEAPLAIAQLPDQSSVIGATVNQTLSAGGGGGSGYTFSAASASLPPGLTLSSSGVISGVVVRSAGTAYPATYAITVTATDPQSCPACVSTPRTTTMSFRWTVNQPPVSVSNPGPQRWTVASIVSSTASSTGLPLSAAGGDGIYLWSATGLPAGVTINPLTGIIAGTPSAVGTGTTTITVTDVLNGVAVTATTTFGWTVFARPTITAPANQTGSIGAAVQVGVASTCPNTPCTYSGTNLPTGVAIDPTTGIIGGTLGGTAQTYPSVTVRVTDFNGAVASSSFSWTVLTAPTVTAPANQSTVNNAAVNLALTASCPNSPCAYRLNGGPTGLSISASGVVTGTVTSAPRTFTGVSVTVTDRAGVTGTSTFFTWTVTAPLVGRWTFDEASGSTAADSSSGGHPATLSGSYGKTAVDVQGANAVTMNGTTGTAASTRGPVLNTLSSFTVSAWVKLSSTADYSTFAAQSGTNVGGFYLQYNPNTNRFRFYKLATDSTGSGGVAQSSIAAPVLGQWYQVTGVYDSTAATISLFVNGVRQGPPVAAPNGFNATGNFTIGAGNFGGLTNWMNGALDDVRAFSNALSDDAVAQLAQAGYWRLDEASGTTAADSSLNNNPGTLTGGVTPTTPIVGSSALQFNGSNGVVTTSSSVLDTAQSFAVTAWAKADTTNTTGAVFSADGASISSFIVQIINGKWTMVSVSGDAPTGVSVTSVPATSALVAGQWYQLTGVYDSVARTIALYVNGVLQGTASVSGSFKASGPLMIGRSYYQGGTNYFPGAIDDVRAYRFMPDQATITALTNLAPPTPGTPAASAGSASASVAWTAPTQVAGYPVTGYVVTPYLGGVAQTPVSYSSTATSQTLTGLTSGGSYTFSVAAVNSSGTSVTSAVSNAVLVS